MSTRKQRGLQVLWIIFISCLFYGMNIFLTTIIVPEEVLKYDAIVINGVVTTSKSIDCSIAMPMAVLFSVISALCFMCLYAILSNVIDYIDGKKEENFLDKGFEFLLKWPVLVEFNHHIEPPAETVDDKFIKMGEKEVEDCLHEDLFKKL